MKEDKQKNFKNSMIGKTLKILVLIILSTAFSFAIFFYNIKTVLNEKNVKKIGARVIENVMGENSEFLNENFDQIIEFAKLYPDENIKIPTGITDVNIEIKGSDLTDVDKDDFYRVIPEKVSTQIYELTINNYINNSIIQNSRIPAFIRTPFQNSAGNVDQTINLAFNVFAISSFCLLIIYFLLEKYNKFLIKTGVLIISNTLPTYFTIYMITPFINSYIRSNGFYLAAPLISNLLDTIMKNYLYISLFGVFILIIGLIIRFVPFREIFRKRGEFEKVIKVKP